MTGNTPPILPGTHGTTSSGPHAAPAPTPPATGTAADPHRIRHLVFIVLGAVIIAATYVDLVATQPQGIGGINQASLVAIIGFLLGALLIAFGAIHRLPTSTVVLLPVAIALNIAVGQLTAVVGSATGFPLFLDSIGTVLVAVLAGPAAGAATGALGAVIWGMTIGPLSLPFAATAAVIGALSGYAARLGLFRRLWTVPIAGLVTGIVASLISSPIAAFVYGGASGGGAAVVVAALRAAGNSLLASTTIQGLLSDPVDKAVVFTVVALVLHGLPKRMRNRYPFVREHSVLSKKK